MTQSSAELIQGYQRHRNLLTWEYSGLAKGRKRNKSLLELMDPKEGYRALLGAAVSATKSTEPTKSKTTTEKKSAQKPAPIRKPKKEEEAEYAAQPLLALDDGKIRLTLNYPLAVMVGFMLVVAVICAVLIGWELGRDRTDKKYRQLLSGQPSKLVKSA